MVNIKSIFKRASSKLRAGWLSQTASRIFALAIPLISVFVAREFLNDVTSELFFVILTDTIAITAFARLGVDIYLPSCRLSNNNKLVIHPAYATIFHGLSLLLLLLMLILSDRLRIPQGFGVSMLVIQGAMYAEIGRSRGKYLIFYMFKSPIIYLTSLVWSIWYMSDLPALNFAALLSLVSLVLLNITSSDFILERVKWRVFVTSAAFSALMVIFSWKDAFVMRFFNDPDALAVIVFYGRMKLAIMFVFALYNARVPNVLRNLDVAPELSFLRSLARRSLGKGLLWGLLMTILALSYCAFTEPELLPVVSILLIASLVVILYGNLAQIFIVMRRTGYLSKVYSVVIVIFLTFVYFLVPLTGLLFAFAVSGLISQIVLGAVLYIDLPRNLNLAIDTGRWNVIE